ncbi:MAG: hypothetical protein WC326_00900 [Candidatus Delongbacteria bacterium]
MATLAKRSSFSTLDFLIILFKHFRLIVAIVLVSTAITALLMLRAPDVFEAQVGIVFNTTSNIRLTEKDRSLGSISLRETMNSETEYLLSSAVLEKTYELTYPERYAAMDPKERLRTVGAIRGKISGLPKRNTTIIEVKYRSQDPEEASRFLNNLVQAQQELKSQRDPGATGMLQDKIQATRADLDSINLLVNEVQLSSQVYSSDRQIAVLVDTNSLLQNQQRELQQRILEQQLVAARYADFLARKPDISHIALPDDNSVLRSIQERFVALQDRQRSLQGTYSDDSVELQALVTSLSAVREEFFQVMASSAAAAGQQLQLVEQKTRVLLEKLRRNEADLTRFPEVNSRLGALLQYREGVNDLLRVLYRQQSEYDLSVIGDRANQTLEMINPALVPQQPVAPRRVLQTAIVFFMSLLASITLAYVLELSSGVFETAQAVEDSLGAPVICTIRQKRN